jgi:hypothetical protein
MKLIRETRITGTFDGFDKNKIFTLASGGKYQQKSPIHRYHFGYRPHVKVFRDGLRWYFDVIGMNQMIEVVRIY